MRFLLTGGAGYIGSHTCVSLLDAGHEVVVLDNFVNSCPEAIARVEKIAGKPITLYEGDCCDAAFVSSVFDKEHIDGVVREPAVHARVLQNVREYAAEIGWHVAGFTYSPIKGPKGNIEFLADIRPGAGDMPDDAQIAALVREAHETLDK